MVTVGQYSERRRGGLIVNLTSILIYCHSIPLLNMQAFNGMISLITHTDRMNIESHDNMG